MRKPENKDLFDFIMSYEAKKLKNNNLQTHIYWLLNDIHDFPICDAPECNNPITKDVGDIYNGYDRTACSCKCARKTEHYLKNYRDSIEKHYGCQHPMHCQEIKDKMRKTTEERWGGIGFASKELSEKERKIFLEKYGSDDPGNLPEFREKSRQTSIENWGVDNPMKTEEVKQKIVETNRERYGVDWFMSTDEFKDKSKQTMIDEHGSVKQAYQDRVEKTKQTKLERYGDENYNNSEQIVKTQVERYGGLWGNKSYNTSKGEKEVLDFVKSIYSGTIIENDRTQMTPNEENKWLENHELDIWLPEINVAIEYNGTYWHTLPNVVESDHFKQIQCESKGIKLVSISEEEWETEPDNCKEILKKVCNLLSSRSYTRCKTTTKQMEVKLMNNRIKNTIKTLAITALFVFPGLSGFPQDMHQDETTISVNSMAEENVSFPILIGMP